MPFPLISGTAPISSAPAYVAPALPASQNVLLLSPLYSDTAVVAASSAVAGLPATNVQAMQPAKVWRSVGQAEFLTLTMAPIAANSLALVGVNLGSAAVIRVRAWNAPNDVTTPGIDTGWMSAWPVTGRPIVANWPSLTCIAQWSNNTLYGSWQIDIADPAVSPGYIEVGRLVLGRAWQPSLDFDMGGTPLGFDPVDVQTKTAYGRTFTDRRTASPPRLFELQFYGLNRREAFDGIAELHRLLGLWGDVVCCLDPGESTDFHRFVMQGVFTAGGAYTLPPAFDGSGNMFGAGIRLRELI